MKVMAASKACKPAKEEDIEGNVMVNKTKIACKRWMNIYYTVYTLGSIVFGVTYCFIMYAVSNITGLIVKMQEEAPIVAAVPLWMMAHFIFMVYMKYRLYKFQEEHAVPTATDSTCQV